MEGVAQALAPLTIDHRVVLMLRIDIDVNAEFERVAFDADQVQRQAHR